MKETNLTEAFCEVLSGISMILLLVPLLDLTGIFSLDKSLALAGNFSATALAGFLLVAYVLGAAVVDAVGLAIEQFFEPLLPKDPVVTDAERKKFWTSVEEHVLRYRDHQWTYYSCYRNLFIMMVPSGICWVILFGRRFGWCVAIWALVAGVLLEIALFKSMLTLLRIYRLITKDIGSEV